MRRGRVLLGVATAGLVAVLLLLGGVFSGPRAVDPLRIAAANSSPSAADQDALGRLLAGFSTGDTAGYVAQLELRAAHRPVDGDSLTLLGLAYQQRARETGDPAFYRLSEARRPRASDAGGRQLLSVQGRAALANTRHRFTEGLTFGRLGVKLDPVALRGECHQLIVGRAARRYRRMAVHDITYASATPADRLTGALPGRRAVASLLRRDVRTETLVMSGAPMRRAEASALPADVTPAPYVATEAALSAVQATRGRADGPACRDAECRPGHHPDARDHQCPRCQPSLRQGECHTQISVRQL